MCVCFVAVRFYSRQMGMFKLEGCWFAFLSDHVEHDANDRCLSVSSVSLNTDFC